MPEGYLVIKLPFRKGQQTVPKIKTYFQNHEEEVRPAVSSSHVPGPHTLARPASPGRNGLQRKTPVFSTGNWVTGGCSVDDYGRNANQNCSEASPLVRMDVVRKSTNNRCWRGCGDRGAVLHGQGGCKLAQGLVYSSDSVTQKHLVFFRVFSNTGYYKTLSIVPWAT